jgi:ribosome-binding protein aMBF1 (putative translation factor)
MLEMIQGEEQYRHTKAQAARFEKALSEFDHDPKSHPGGHPRLVRAQREAMESQLACLRREVEEYERLRQGAEVPLDVESLEELPDRLIQARIAAGLTHKQLAERLRMKEQQIQRYEGTRYASASLSRLIEVARALRDRTEGVVASKGGPGEGTRQVG